jgi:hypothetical protein
VPDLSERRVDAWTALAAEPAVRAAERAIVTGSPAVLADTLAVSTAAESRRRLAHVLELKDRADRDPALRDAYQRAADDLRSWAATVYLAALREPRGCRLASTAPIGQNPFTEESISLRRSAPRPPFPGQRRRSPFALPQMESSPHRGPGSPRPGCEQSTRPEEERR